MAAQMRSFGQIQELLVASPHYLQRAGRPQLPEQLAEHVTLSVKGTMRASAGNCTLALDGEVRRIELQPRITGFDFSNDVDDGARWHGHHLVAGNSVCRSGTPRRTGSGVTAMAAAAGIAHAVFASRRGMLPAVRVFIDFLAEKMPRLLEAARLRQ